MKIAIAGMGYVGLSLAVLLAQHHTVYAVDIAEEKVEILNNRKSPIRDSYIESYLSNKDLDIVATTDARSAYESAEFVIIAVPTNYDSDRNSFDTSAVEAVVQTVLRYNPNAVMVIKSTVPIGYTDRIREEFRTENILFSPEFLREGKALSYSVFLVAFLLDDCIRTDEDVERYLGLSILGDIPDANDVKRHQYGYYASYGEISNKISGKKRRV